MKSSRKCVLAVGFGREDRYRLQTRWLASGLRLPLVPLRDPSQTVAYLKAAGTIPSEMHPLPVVLLLNLRLNTPAAPPEPCPDKKPQPETLLDGLAAVDGLHLLEKVRQPPAFRDLVTIVCHTEWKEWELRKAYALGADCCLTAGDDFSHVIYRLQRLESYWFDEESRTDHKPPLKDANFKDRNIGATW